MDTRRLFFQHVAQTSGAPLAIHIEKAKGSLLRDASGKEYIDLIAGISVCNVGHCHPAVVKAVKKQVENYMHVLVYGEMVETPQVQYATALTKHLPASLNSVYFTNSGAEAVEGAMKLAKRHTNRTQIIAFNKSYHGSTQGALSIIGDEYWRNAFRPLLPAIQHHDYNSADVLEAINDSTACVILEPVQAERGVIKADKQWIYDVRKKCEQTGTLFILDEIQTGFGRTGTLWAFEQLKLVPDILLLGKALGGGMPLGAFIADRQMMGDLSDNPVLGHITTFGGHPVSCAAGHAAFKVLLKKDTIDKVNKKANLFARLLSVPGVRQFRSAGLLIALAFDEPRLAKQIIDHCIAKGVLTDWFLFAPDCLRIAPPLTISRTEIEQACKVIREAIALHTR